MKTITPGNAEVVLRTVIYSDLFPSLVEVEELADWIALDDFESSRSIQASVDDVFRSSDEAALVVVNQESHQLGDILGLADSLQGQQLTGSFQRFLFPG